LTARTSVFSGSLPLFSCQGAARSEARETCPAQNAEYGASVALRQTNRRSRRTALRRSRTGAGRAVQDWPLMAAGEPRSRAGIRACLRHQPLIRRVFTW
jgi:hypothetical protein